MSDTTMRREMSDTRAVHRHLVKAHERLQAALGDYREEPEERSYQMRDEQVIARTKAAQE